VGCGTGELALTLAARGHQITAIDPEAPDGAIFEQVALEEFSDTNLFDAVVASRSLHHVHDLAAGLAKIHSLLEGGVLILNEFAWDRMDEATARWYLSKKPKPDPKDKSLLPGNFPNAWIKEHEDLHGASAMLSLLDERFARERFEWVPYMAEHYLERPDLISEEEYLGDKGEISLIGFRYVGRAIPRQWGHCSKSLQDFRKQSSPLCPPSARE
jgi:SAM-dependent methyltransferase